MAEPSRAVHADPSGRVRSISQVLLGIVIAALYLPALAPVGVRTDISAHLVFAQHLSLTGRSPVAYPLFHQATIVVRALIPFELLAKVNPDLDARLTTWDIAAVATLLGFVILTAELVYSRFLADASLWSRRRAYPVCLALTLCALTVTPVTILTWSRHQLLRGYVGINTFDSPTFIVLTPLALALFWQLTDRLFCRSGTRATAFLAVLSLLTLHAKPSYTVCLLPAVCLFIVVARARQKSPDWRLVLLGLVVPSVLYLAYQELTFDQQGSVVIAPFEEVSFFLEAHDQSIWMFFPLLLLSALFPVTVTLAYWGQWRHRTSFILAWVTFAIGVALYSLLSIRGRPDYGDFITCAQISLLILFVESMRFVIAQQSDVGIRNATSRSTLSFDLRMSLVTVAFTLHVVCGTLFYYQEVTNPADWW